MSEIAWHCYESRAIGKRLRLVHTCTAPDVEVAIATFASRTGHHPTEFARGERAWQQTRTRYLVVAAINRRAS